MAFEDLYALPTLSQIKSEVLSIATAAELKVTSWILGRPSERWIEITARATELFAATVTTQAVRGFFLDLATDPGDPGDLSADQTPRPGWLSALGASWYGVNRRGQTFATTNELVTNVGSTPATFAPFDLTFERNTANADGGRPTYRNTTDPSIYTGLGGTLTLAPEATAIIPVIAEQAGSYGSAVAGAISTVVTQSFGTLTCSNPSAAVGTDREAPDTYRARCRIAASRLSPGGPGAAYRYASNTARDGSPLQRFDGSGLVGITETYVSSDSATGKVTLYFRDKDGAPDAVDVSSANANITGIALGVITDPLGVLPDAVTPLPTVSDPNTGGPGGAAAIAVPITLAGTAKIKARPGVTGSALIALAQQAIAEQLDEITFPAIPIGGLDQVAGAGVLYRSDLQDDIRDSTDGMYAVNLTLPATSTTAIAEGRVATRVAVPAVSGVTSSTGLIKITTTAPHGLTTGAAVQIYGVEGTTEANGAWTITSVDATNFTLDGSAFVHAYVSGGAISRIVLTVMP
jgi:baseplate J-like protein/ubiquitin-activating enzyme E1-like protein